MGSRSIAGRRPRLGATRASAPRTVLCVLMAMMAALMLASSACSTNDQGAQPAPGAPVFKPSGFKDLPRYPNSREAGGLSVKNGVETQSFLVDGASPQNVMDFYKKELNGWTAAKVDESGTALRQDFTGPDGDFVRLSATSLSRGDTNSIQYSLEFH